ncbi:MAG TPA: hypothetical protein DCP51_08355 [Clostridiales bacterium]|nr:hypothetical protein [Clostridiales bacterium]
MSSNIKMKNINFVKAYKRNDKASIYSKASFKVAVSLLIFSLIFASTYAYIGYRNLQTKKELAVYNEYINNDKNKKLLEQALNDEIENNTLFSQKKNMLVAQEALESVHFFTKSDIKEFFACGGSSVTISNIIYNNELLTISFDAAAGSVNAISDYLDRLKKTDLFGNIEYFGYEKETELNYTFNLTCHLKAVNER